MIDNTVEFVSVCRISEDYNGYIWLTRIADIDNQQLNFPYKSNRNTTYFENRDRLYRNDGPSKVGTIGVWRWTASPNLNDPETDYVQSFFVPDLCPIRVVVVQDVKSTQSLVEALKCGTVWSKPYICDTLFCYESAWGQFSGILCRSDEFTIQNQNAKLNDTIYSLPCFSFKADEIYNWDDKHLRFLKRLTLGDPEKYITIGNVDELIRSTISDRMTWKLYRDYIGKTKAEWRDCKALFDRACADSLYEEVADKLSCPLENAHEAVEGFIKRASARISEGDIDSDILAQIAMNHEGLRAQCESAIEEHWKSAHAAEIAAAQAECDRMKQASGEIVNKYKAQFEQIKEEKKAAEADRQKILNETAEAQTKLEQLLKEIETYEALGTNTVQAVRDKIGAAQKDMAGFIAELSAFMPQQATQGSGSYEMKPTNRWTFASGAVCNDTEDVEECSSWKDTLVLLWDNLQLAGVGSQWTGMLSSFLYSAYLNQMPLLLAGPNAEAIANALSMTLCGKTLDILKCSGEQDSEAISEYAKSELAAVQNPFHSDWITCMPQTANNRFTLWLHPFTEDLQIEPRSLYNYVYPVFTECFIDQLPSYKNMVAGRMAEQYTKFQSDSRYRAKLGYIKKLGMSRLVIKRLEKVLADAKCMGAVSDVSMEYLFGMLPLSVLSSKQDTLAELLDNEKNLTTEVKTELQRYIEE